MRKFWSFSDEGNIRTLRIEGQIADETWFGDEVTPQLFKNDLNAGKVTSPSGLIVQGVMFLPQHKSITC